MGKCVSVQMGYGSVVHLSFPPNQHSISEKNVIDKLKEKGYVAKDGIYGVVIHSTQRPTPYSGIFPAWLPANMYQIKNLDALELRYGYSYSTDSRKAFGDVKPDYKTINLGYDQMLP